ncbi:cytochrome P450 [Zopfia rhizophila CBS 207.26]|uniref:Cytochrome P450 n=1 Tax=Zopfia rhizophila CBS 207.26 TaxID=1314779 RepID=A0A6A6EYB1_9PEZI|nr:cytochrome P450 [Zopfia rhizophila CBS 207.26]
MFRVVSRMRNHGFFEYTRQILDNPGKTVELNMFGSRLILTQQPENIKAVMFTKFSDFGKGAITHKIFENVLGDSEQLRPYLAKIRSTDVPKTEVHIQRLFRHFRTPGEPVEVYDLIDRCQLDVVTDVFFGESVASLQQEEQPFREAMDTLLRINSQRVPFGRLALLFPDWLIAPHATKELARYMDSRVDKTLSLPRAKLLQKAENEITLMEALALLQPNKKYIKDQLISVLLAGKDPVAITITWAIYELSRHPEVFTRLQDEVRTRIGFDHPPSMEQLKELVLLKNAVKETLRLYHPLGLNVREAKADTFLPIGGGANGKEPVAVLKGQQVVYSVLGVQRDPKLHSETADEWVPSRWESWTPTSTEYIPFNVGPRICLGRVFGHLQMEYTLARILQEFERIEWCGAKEDMKIKIELNTKFDKPILCKFIPRVKVES